MRILFAFVFTAVFLTACTTAPETQSTVRVLPAADPAKAASASVNQIGIAPRTAQGLTASSQIHRATDPNALTVGQLKDYADRCGPEARRAPPAGLDCSDLKLRMERVFKSDDAVARALVTLGQLSQAPTGTSVEANALAGGLLDGEVAQSTLTDTTSNDITAFLEANGLAVTGGVIIATGGGTP